ncbi:MAG: hypothetical protein FWC20_08355 [Oscillospiraceae bacterium]|nr:hypothetical protein [Oscillospiraceae bacterium]MCL2279398.1 hypothetical protein [Oscillospiraceae bacterium]
MNKKLLLTLIPAAIYVVLSIAGFGLSGRFGGLVYRLVIIVYLLYACVLVWRGAAGGGRETVFTGALGLGLFAVREIYHLVYVYLLGGYSGDITVGNYIRNCAYLFFMAALLCSISPTVKGKKIIQIGASALSAGAIFCILYGVLSGNPYLLYYSALAMVVMAVLSAVCLLITRERKAKTFAWSVIAVCALDTIYRLLTLPAFAPGWHWRDIAVSFYPAAYMLLAFALIRLREGAVSNG